MPVIVKQSQAVTALTAESSQEIQITRKNIIVEAQKLNTSIVYVACSQDSYRPALDSFEPIGIGEAKFYSAEKGRKIQSLWVYAIAATQYINYVASDGAIGRPLSQDFSEYSTIYNATEGKEYTERWEQGTFDARKYTGRTGAWYQSQATERDRNKWLPPPFSTGVNTLDAAPNNNAIHMTNANPIDGTADSLYVGLPKTFKRAKLNFQAYLPAGASLAANDYIYIGFENTSRAVHTAAWLTGSAGGYYLMVGSVGRSGITYATQAVVPSVTNAWYDYELELDYPYLRLWEVNVGTGVYTFLGQVQFPVDSHPCDWLMLFFANESVGVHDEFYIGQFGIIAFDVEGVHVIGEVSQKTSTNAMVSALKVRNTTENGMLVQIHEHNTNAIAYQILASMDGVTYFTLIASTTILQNGSTSILIPDPWLYIDVQIIDNVAGTHGKADITIGGS